MPTFSRRRALQFAASALAAPLVLPSRIFGKGGAVSPSNRITIGMIGVGDHGINRNMNLLHQNADAHILAVCDVDSLRKDAARDRNDRHFAKAFNQPDYKSTTAHTDFREIIARDDIDAVMVSTPDHWHIIPSVYAARAGKDVICEKPLTLTIAEGRILSDTFRQHGRVFQTSSENRSIPSYRRMCEIVRNGRLGKLHRIEVGLPSGGRGPNLAKLEFTDPPATLDYDLWLGQAPVAPYHAGRIHWNFRWLFDYSGGMLTDWGAHLIDLAQWAHDSELTGPMSVEGTGEIAPHPLYNTYTSFDLSYEYADGVKLRVFSKIPSLRFEGTDGWIDCQGWRGKVTASHERILEPLAPGELRLYGAVEDGEHRNFLDCVKSRRQCYAPAEVGHRTISIAHIGNIALLTGRKLRWNPQSEQFHDDPTANQMLTRPARDPWRL